MFKLLKKSPTSARIGLGIILLNVFVCIFAPVISPYGETDVSGDVFRFGREREKPQKLEIDVEIETDFTKVAENDDPNFGIDLNTIYDHVILALKEEVYTIEAIAHRIWRHLKNLGSAGRIKVKVKKLNPPINEEVKYSEAMIEE